jgi:hypothetical protein
MILGIMSVVQVRYDRDSHATLLDRIQLCRDLVENAMLLEGPD